MWEDIDAIRKLEATGILYHVEGDEFDTQSESKTGATISDRCFSTNPSDASSPSSAQASRVASVNNIVEMTGAASLTPQ